MGSISYPELVHGAFHLLIFNKAKFVVGRSFKLNIFVRIYKIHTAFGGHGCIRKHRHGHCLDLVVESLQSNMLRDEHSHSRLLGRYLQLIKTRVELPQIYLNRLKIRHELASDGILLAEEHDFWTRLPKKVSYLAPALLVD
jgi:hypothetical protein